MSNLLKYALTGLFALELTLGLSCSKKEETNYTSDVIERVIPRQPQRLDVIEPWTEFYVVKKGDNLWKIAKDHGTTLEEILELNPQYRENPDLIFPRDTVIIPEYYEEVEGIIVTPERPIIERDL